MEVDSWIHRPGVAQYFGADWSNEVKRLASLTLEEAKNIATTDPKITFFFYVKDGPIYIQTKGIFNQGDTVFFSGTPWYTASGKADAYEKAVNISSLFDIPAEDWASINKRVCKVLDSWQHRLRYKLLLEQQSISSDYDYLYHLPNYELLRQVCADWQATTFPGFVSFTEQLVTYAEKTVNTYQPTLNTKLEDLKYGKMPRTKIYKELLQIVILMEKEIVDIKSKADFLSQQMDKFDRENDLADAKIQNPIAEWRALGSKPSNAINSVRGRWETIASDIANIKASLADAADNETASINIKVKLVDAIDDWATLANKARQFLVGISRVSKNENSRQA